MLRQIAAGRVARVYLASDGSDVCAVKIFGAAFASHADREHRFGRGLEHPHLNRIDARVEVEGRAAVRMPFVPGVQLSRWRPIHGTHANVVTVVAHLLDGLGYLHDRGVVHRDVKPENILVDRADLPVLVDFDLAAEVGESIGEGGWAGTAAYLSPSRARGEPAGPVDDLYSAGVVLYWALTGELPFDGSLADVLEAHRRSEAPPPSAHDPALARFDAWMARALAKTAVEGFSSAREMRAELVSLVGPAPSSTSTQAGGADGNG